MGRQSIITRSKVKTDVNDMAILCVLSVGRAIERGKACILSIQERRGCGQSCQESVFHIRTSARMGKSFVSCELHILPLKIHTRQFRDMGNTSRRRPEPFSYSIRDILGRDGFSTGSRGCLYRSITNGQTWWEIYWSVKCKSGLFPFFV